MHPERDGMTPEMFFDGFPLGLQVFEEVERAVNALGEATIAVTKSQIAFRRRKAFAFVWRPGQYVNNEVAAVLSLALGREVVSDSIKSVAHPAPKVWMHHIELARPRELDDQVRQWLREAYEDAG